VSLSDLDVYAVMEGERACHEAAERWRRTAPSDGALREVGLGAPLEVAFLTRSQLTRLPARPGTLALRDHGRVVRGDPAVLALVPAYRPMDVSAEEVALLIENRSFELLGAWPDLSAEQRLPRLRARHAVLKTVLDLVTAAALVEGYWSSDPGALAAWARGRRAPQIGADRLLETAVAWRERGAEDAPLAQLRDEWKETTRRWTATWRALGPPLADPEALIRQRARRARLRRRVRLAAMPEARSGRGPALGNRLRHALAGTPQHRVNGAAATLVLAAVDTWGTESDSPAPSLPAWAVRALDGLGVVPKRDRGSWPRAAARVVRAWDDWVLDGRHRMEG
jgi:hypothetical protein